MLQKATKATKQDHTKSTLKKAHLKEHVKATLGSLIHSSVRTGG